MMDGRIGKIRNSLDKKILKMLVLFRMQLNNKSSLYGPFRDAVGKTKLKSDKKTYQMDYRNSFDILERLVLILKKVQI